MLRVLEAQAPPKQNATDTINTLSNRLNSATLLEDRRSAILGLRSFAKAYPASVASGALRSLISTLTKDVDDIDTGKLVLETLLMLFSPNEDSPETSEDISLWLADEFSQRQDNITILLDLLENQDFYSRLYALQLLSAISSARPVRTQECILSAPLGTTRMVAVLDDPREAVRAAGLLLLNDITQSNIELQKLVAFENAFERIFGLIQIEGGLYEGGIIVQDCLSLLANLLHLNAANQSLFRETGHVMRLAALLAPQERDSSANDEDLDPSTVREKNLWGFLTVLRMFLIQKNIGTQANQIAFEKHGVLKLVLHLGFDDTVGYKIRAEALQTCADMIRGNSRIQEGFAHNKVTLPSSRDIKGDSTKNTNGVSQIYIIDALLDITLSPSSPSLFDVRFSACQCIAAYFFNHKQIQLHFLRRAIEGYSLGEDETSNVLSILILGHRIPSLVDPYRLWFAAHLTSNLLLNDREAKTLASAISEGDAEKGEEVVTAIQSITANLITALQSDEDDRIRVGYLMLLCVWLFDDAEAVNDFLSEGSAVQSLIKAAGKTQPGHEISQGLCVVLLGILYEFSSKESPLPRRTLQPLLISGLGREHYVSKIGQLRSDPLLRDFEILAQDSSSALHAGGWPEVYFDQDFVDFLKDNFNRIVRAIDKDPGIEVAILSQPEGIDRDLLDSLRSTIEGQTEALQKAENEKVALEGKLAQEQAEHRRTQQLSNAEVTRIKNINEAIQRNHESELAQKDTQQKTATSSLQEAHRKRTQDLENRIQQLTVDSSKQIDGLRLKHDTERARLENQIADLLSTQKQAQETIETLKRTTDSLSRNLKEQDQRLQTAKSDKKELEDHIEINLVSSRNLDQQVKEQNIKLEEAQSIEKDLRTEIKQSEEARAAVQTELDDLLIVLGDLEEKRTQDKKKLKDLGAEVSDAEEEGEVEDDEEID